MGAGPCITRSPLPQPWTLRVEMCFPAFPLEKVQLPPCWKEAGGDCSRLGLDAQGSGVGRWRELGVWSLANPGSNPGSNTYNAV